MKTLILLNIAATIALSANAQQNNTDPSSEPKSTFIITLNGTEHRVVEGEEANLGSACDGAGITVVQDAFKTFNSNTVVFEYPRDFAFEYESGIGYRNWSFDGNDFVILYFELDPATDFDDVVDEMVGQFGKENCTVSRTTTKLGGKTSSGKRILIELVGQKLTMDLYELEEAEDHVRYIIFQDLLDEDGNESEESKRTIERIRNTFSY